MRTSLPLRLLAVMISLTAMAAGQHEFLKGSTPNGASLTGTSPFSQPPKYGWVPVVFELTNPTKREVTWEVRQQAPRYSGEGGFSRSFSLTCPPGESRASTVMLAFGGPVDTSRHGYYSSTLTLSATADGITISGNLGGFGSGNEGRLVLRGNQVPHRGDSGRSEWIGFETPLAPTDWRAYQGFSGAIITDSEWRALAPGAKLALTTWVKTGGVLAITATDPASTPATLGLSASDPGPSPTAYGLGQLKVTSGDDLADAAKFVESNALDDATRQTSGDSRTNQWRQRAPGYFASQDQSMLNLLLLGVVLVFAIIIGPINLFVIAPAVRRHRLFFSVPVISLATVLLLLAAVLLGDGVGGKGTRFVLIENRPGEGENTNHVIQYQTSRCGVMFSTGFTAPGSVFVEGLGSPNSSARVEGNFQLVPEADGLHASGPWFSSRTSQHFRLAGVAPTRGRIELTGTGATAKLTSTFEFPLEKIYFPTADGKWWQASGLKPGEPVAVTSIGYAEFDQAVKVALKEAPEEIPLRIVELRKRDLHYVAFTAAPAAIATHGSIKWTDHGIVTGPLVTP